MNEKNDACVSFFDPILGICKSDETPSLVFVILHDGITWWGTSSSYPLELPVAQHAMETSAELAIPSYTDRT